MQAAVPVRQQENYLREILFICFAQKKLIINIFLLIFSVVVAVAFLYPPVYTAHTTLLVKGKRVERNPEVIAPTEERIQPISKSDLNSEMTTLTSESVLRDTILSLQKDSHIFNIAEEDLIEQKNISVMELINRDNSLSRALKKLKKSISVSNTPASNVLEVSIKWDSPQSAQAILDALLNNYFLYRNNVDKPEKIRDFYNQTVEDYQTAINEKHQQKMKLIKEINANDAHEEIISNLALKKDYQQQLTLLQRDKNDLQATVAHLKQQLNLKDVHTFPGIDNVSVRQQATLVQQTQAKFTELSKHYLPKSQVMKSARKELELNFAQLQNEVRSLLNYHQAKIDSLNKDIQYLQQQVDTLVQRNINLAQLDVELKKIQRDSELLEVAFANYYTLREEATMRDKTQSANLQTQVIILNPPWADRKPTFPDKRFLLPFGVFIAFLVALTAGFIREYFDHSFKRTDDSLRYLGIPCVLAVSEYHK